MPVGDPARSTRARLGLALAALAAIGLAVAAYLSFRKLSGKSAVCVVGGGCEVVDASRYSVLFGVPVALFGVAWSSVALLASVWWRRTGDRRPVMLLYVGGLVATLVEVYLVYLELFVIRAICSWCVIYGITVVLGWMGAVAAVRLVGPGGPDAEPPG